jgi:hypothetical protein
MRNNTRRALRATATVAGVAALAGTFAGTAFADGLGGLGGGDNNYGSSDSHGLSGFGDSDGESLVHEPGLATFELPGIGMGSRGMRTDGGIPLLDALDGGDDDYGDGPQHPVDNEGGNFAENVDLLGHDMNSSHRGQSIGHRSYRTDGDLGGIGGSSDDEDYSDGLGDSDILSHDNRRNDSDNYGDDDADGLSGHALKLPLGT